MTRKLADLHVQIGCSCRPYAVAPRSWSSSISDSAPFLICAVYAACSFFASLTGRSCIWLGGNTNVWTKLSRSGLNLRPTISRLCSLQNSQKASASMTCRCTPVASTIRHFKNPRSIHLCTSSARTCKARARLCFVNQSCPMRALAPSRCNMACTEVRERRSSTVTSCRECDAIKSTSFCCSVFVHGR